jgi:hypothetical protein
MTEFSMKNPKKNQFERVKRDVSGMVAGWLAYERLNHQKIHSGR